MAKIRRIDLSPDEWIAGTQGMSLEEEGLYTRIIMRYYSRGEALPSDPLKIAKICNVRPQMIRRILPKLLTKFDETAGKLRQNRCETEIKLAEKRRISAGLNGAKGGRPKGLEKPDGFAHGKAHARVPSPFKKEDSVKEASASLPALGEPRAASLEPSPKDAVKELWERGVAILGGNRRSLLGKMIKQYGEFVVLRAITQTELKQPPAPVDYFIGCCEKMHRDSVAEKTASPSTKMLIGGRNAVDRLIAQDQTPRNTDNDYDTDVPLLDRRRNHSPA